MINPIDVIMVGVRQDMMRMNAIANNTANALTPGFKREYLAVSGQVGGNIEPGYGLVRDMRAGVPKQTGAPLDFAVLGQGYFEVQTEQGLAYTRQGAFHLDQNGYLVTQAGHQVIGDSGAIRLNSASPAIDRSGAIFENDKRVGQMKVVQFDRPAMLSNIGGGLQIESGDAGKQVRQIAVAQGQLESSNVDSTQEMVSLMETFRHFETSNRVIQAYDDMHDKALKGLGQF